MILHKTITFLLIYAGVCLAKVCVDDDVKGPEISKIRNETDSGDIQNQGFLDLSGSIDCYGVIKAWQFVWIVSGPASCHDVMFQVWRPQASAPGSYILVGQTLFSPTVYQCEPFVTAESSSSPSTSTLTTAHVTSGYTYTTERTDTTNSLTTTVAASTTSVIETTPYSYPDWELVTLNMTMAEYLPVQPGDLYGWMDIGASTSERRIPFESAPSGSGQFNKVLILPTGSVTDNVGDVIQWSSGQTVVRNYSLNIIMSTRERPYIISPDPNCTKDCVVADLLENRPPGDLIYRVRALNNFNYNPVIPPSLAYSLANDNCSAFSIDPSTGDVTTVASLNYEDLSAAGPGPPVWCTAEVTAHEGPYTSMPATLIVSITDENEQHSMTNLPNWTSPIDVNTIGPNTKVFEIQLTDEDDPSSWPLKNFSILYTIPINSPFDVTTLSYTSGEVNASADMSTWIRSEKCTLGIMSVDDVNRDGPSELVVDLTNTRDNVLITNLPAVVYVEEGNPTSGLLYRVEAKAMPTTRTDDVQFFISSVYPKNVSDSLFAVDDKNGNVTLPNLTEFDCFAINQYQIEIVANYTSQPSQPSHPVNLTLSVTWRNEKPYFDRTDPLTAQMAESEVVGSYIPGVELTGKDRDVVLGDWIYYSLTGDGSSLFRPNNVTNRIEVIRQLAVPPGKDQVTYDLSVAVIDSHGARSDVNLTVSVSVTDVNDHSPVTDAIYYKGTVPGDMDAPLYCGVTISTSDDDGPSNTNIEYYVIDSVASLYFQLNSTGQVFSKQPVPHSLYQTIDFSVLVTDNGRPTPLNTTVQVSIDVTGSNVNAPEFWQKFDALDLRVDVDVGSVVYTVSAYDNDSDSINRIHYSLWMISDYYIVSSVSGDVSVRRNLPAYMKEILHVEAKDNAPDPHYSDRPFVLRIDTYNPKQTLVDIHLDVPQSDFLETKEAFLVAMNNLIPYWDIRIESNKHDRDNTIVTVYAVESSYPDNPGNETLDKVFIKVENLLDVLRSNLQGDPTEGLLGPEFAPWQPYRVEPTHPIWITDTAGGVAFLSILCIMTVAGLITMSVLLAKKYCPKKQSKRFSPRSNKITPYEEIFTLKYLDTSRPASVFHLSTPQNPVPFPSSAALSGRLSDVQPLTKVSINDKPLPRQQESSA